MVLKLNEVPSIFPEAQRAGEGFDSDIIWSDVGYGIVPIGGIVAWCKTLVFGTSAALLIPNFLECNGQVVVDGGSPFDGMALPDLNGAGAGNNRFLRGSSTSGTTGGAATHAHTLLLATPPIHGGAPDGTYEPTTTTVSHIPPYYEVVWVIRIK
jgi:hypothetical protein